jgi:hypothetical protein
MRAASRTNVSQETIFTISLHSCYDCPSSPDELMQEEFQLLGSNTLKQLKDVIYCVNGLADLPIQEIPFPSSSSTSSSSSSPSPFLESCFFIEGVFYLDEEELPDGVTLADIQNDLRSECSSSSRRGVVPIRGLDWLCRVYQTHFKPSTATTSASASVAPSPLVRSAMESFLNSRYNLLHPSSSSSAPSPPTLPPPDTSSSFALTVLSMNSTLLSSLKIRLGLRYLFCHMKQICEHFLYFSDLRLFNTATDYQQLSMPSSSTTPTATTPSTSATPRSSHQHRQHQHQSLSETYPKLTYLTKLVRKKCEICLLWSAQYLVYGDRLVVNNPTLFCQHCYQMLHYTVEGEGLYDDYTVLPYLHDMK